MKKIMLVLCMLVFLTSCSSTKTPSEVEKNDKKITTSDEESATKKVKEQAAEKEETVAKLSAEDIFGDLMGSHVATDYIDDFAKTRSAVLSYDKYASVRIYENDGEYFIMQVNTFQGGPEGKFESLEYVGNGNYELIFKETGDYGVGCRVYYNPGKKVVQVRFDKDMSMWKLNKEVYDFYMDDINTVLGDKLSKLLFKGIITTSDAPVSVKVKDKYYNVYVMPHTSSNTSFVLDDGDGGFVDLIHNGEENGRIFAKYRYENGKVTLIDEYGEVLGVFE